MAFRKKLPSGNTIESWIFDTAFEKGISIGVFDKMLGRSKMIVCVEELDGEKRIIIDESRAEKYGFKVIWKE